MKVLLTISLLLLGLVSFSQSDYQPGHMIEINCLVLDQNSNDSIPFSIVEIIKNDEVIYSSISDFNGAVKFNICSNQLQYDTISFRILGVGYFPKTIEPKIQTDTSLIFLVVQNPKDSITKEKIREFTSSYSSGECGTYELEKAYKENNLYRHCDGRVMSFTEIMEVEGNTNEWEMIKK